MKVLMIDNYDSFTYNLVQYLGEMGARIDVRRNDALGLDDIEALGPDRIVISPGPGRPENAGISLDVIRLFGGRIPILGVCLGHQAIGQAFGAQIIHAPELRHGKTSRIFHDGAALFHDLASPFEATRYHSLIVNHHELPDCLEVTAWTDEGIIMGLQHRQQALFGVQFHPESILTRSGKALLGRFLCWES